MVSDLSDADVLRCKYLTDMDFAPSAVQATAPRDGNGYVAEGEMQF